MSEEVTNKLQKIDHKFKRLKKKIDLLLNSNKYRINEKKYITAREVKDLTGLNDRTILRRRYINQPWLSNFYRKEFAQAIYFEVFCG